MSCPHKFQEYLYLEKLDFEPETLILGTFNPAWPEDNYAEWFYGRTGNNYFWDVLPRVYGRESLLTSDTKEWKSFCKENKIAITDLISQINDADQTKPEHHKILKSYSDKGIATHFKEFNFVDIPSILYRFPTIHNVYLTRSIGDAFWKRLAMPIKQTCIERGIGFTPLMTPSGYAFYQQGRYNKRNPENPLSIKDFIYQKWKEIWTKTP